MKKTTTTLLIVSAMTFLVITMGVLNAQAPVGAPGGRGGGRGGGVAPALFAAADTNKDGSLTRNELKSTFDAWYTSWDGAKSNSLMLDQVQTGLSFAFPAPAPPDYVGAMMAALPTTPGAKPLHPRKILVYGRSAGFVHSSIPLAAKTVEALGNKGNLWTTTISYNPNDINTANLKQYDAIFLDSTTGCFLDDPDRAASLARRQAFLEFVRSGKGVAGMHAATDSYHTNCASTPVAANPDDAAAGRNAAGAGGGGRGGVATTLATQFIAQADKNGDQKLSRQEFASLADTWFDKLDSSKSGKVSQADFVQNFNASVMPAAPQGGRAGGGRGGSGGFGAGRGAGGGSGRAGGGNQGPVLDWPEFNKLIGGYFKFHWSGLHSWVKIDDPNSPLTAMFHGQEFEFTDETYTFAQDSFSRTNVHVLTSIDYDKMPAADKAAEANPRTDHDFALSYIRREGQGRVFYEAYGHAETNYAVTPMLEHIRAGIQYALGDLKADDSPSKK